MVMLLSHLLVAVLVLVVEEEVVFLHIVVLWGSKPHLADKVLVVEVDKLLWQDLVVVHQDMALVVEEELEVL